MFGKKAVQAILVILFINLSMSYAETLNVSIRIRNDRLDEKIINRENLVAIKQFIIKNGLRITYSQMYNNNPAYVTKRFGFYLNPDNGQMNINCELDKSDFQTLVIHDPNNKNQYCYIDFHNEYEINISIPIRFRMSDVDLTVSQIREFASEAIQEILSEISKDTPVSMLQPKITTDTRNFMNAIDLAIQAIQKDSLLHGTEYVLMSVQQIPTTNKWIWLVIFKPKMFVPVDPSTGMHADGAELSVNVDLDTKETKIIYGK